MITDAKIEEIILATINGYMKQTGSPNADLEGFRTALDELLAKRLEEYYKSRFTTLGIDELVRVRRALSNLIESGSVTAIDGGPSQ